MIIQNIGDIPNKSWIRPGLELRKSGIHGYGIFASMPIKKGEKVIVWGGQVFTKEEAFNGTAKNHTIVGIDENLYLGSPADTDFSLDDYMNHSCNPNVWMSNGITLVARRDINANEELTADYAIWLENEAYVMKNQCSCGSKQCRKVITGKDWRRPEIQNAYAHHFAPFILRRIMNLVNQ